MITILLALIVMAAVTWALVTNHPRPVWRPPTQWERFIWAARQAGVSMTAWQEQLAKLVLAGHRLEISAARAARSFRSFGRAMDLDKRP